MPEMRGMGRGLAAILERGGAQTGSLRQVPIDAIVPNPLQPRRHFDAEALQELAESIRRKGVLQPLVVRPADRGYELIAGERRLRAARLAGLVTVPVIVRELADEERLEVALAENLARADLNPVETARALATLVEDLGCPKAEVARRVGRSRASVANAIRLLELPDDVLEMLERGELSEGHGRALLMCKDHDQRRLLARLARDNGWSVRQTEEAARRAGEAGEARDQRPPRSDEGRDLAAAELVERLEALFESSLAVPARVRARRSGRVVIELASAEAAALLCERLGQVAAQEGATREAVLRAA